MNDLKKVISIGILGVFVVLFLVALITGNVHFGKTVDKEPLVNAIHNTYNSDQMEYNYSFQGRIAYKIGGVFGPWADAETSGNVKWNNDDSLESNFIVARESSGLLLFDSNEYIYNIGDSVFVEKLDDELDLTYTTSEGNFDSTYTFETNVFGSILSDIDEDDISSVTFFDELGIYNVRFSDSINTAFANQMSSLAQTAFSSDGTSSPVSLSMDCEMTIKDGYIDSFEISVALEVTDVELSFEFIQNFISFDNVLIEIPLHDNVIRGDLLINQLVDLNTAFDEFFSSNYSNYSFDYRNQIDPGVFSISLGTDFRGTHKVKELDGIYYFNNYYELDSDYKPDLPDQKQSIALVNNDNQECWLELFNPTFNDYESVTEYDSIYETNFTNIDYTSLLDSIEFLIIENNEGSTSYKLGVSGESVFLFFELLNESINYEAYQYDDDLEIGALEIEVHTIDGVIQEIYIFAEGRYVDTEGVRQNYTIKLDYSSNGISSEEYEIPTNKEDVN